MNNLILEELLENIQEQWDNNECKLEIVLRTTEPADNLDVVIQTLLSYVEIGSRKVAIY
jgi:sugar diacid utilization regulator